jgi:hypothetical protein
MAVFSTLGMIAGGIGAAGAAAGALGAAALPAIASGAGLIGSGLAGAAGLAGEAAKWLNTPEGKALSDAVGADKAAQLKRQELERAQSEIEKGRTFESTEAEKASQRISERERLAREGTSTEAEKTRGFTSLEDQKAYERISERERLAREGTSTEAEKTRGFTSTEAEKAYQRQLEELKKQQEFALGTEERARLERGEGIKRGQEMLSGGESQFMSETAQASPELAAMQKALGEQTSEDVQKLRGETAAGLTQRGVRGAQAGTVLGRTMGEYRKGRERDVAQMALDEAKQRREARTSYLGQKALTGARGAI